MGKKLKVNNTIMVVDCLNLTTVPAGIFVSEQSLLRVAGKLGVSDEISARLKSSESQGDVRIVEREQETQEGQVEDKWWFWVMGVESKDQD